MSQPLRSKEYFDQRATEEMAQHLKSKKDDTQGAACLRRAHSSHDWPGGGARGAAQRSPEREDTYWTLRFGLGFEEATADDFIEVDKDLNTVSGEGMANPATRFHLWVYRNRPDVMSIIHTHSPWASALAAARQPLVISQMDMTPLFNDCAFLGEWPGVPIADHEGTLISEALGAMKSIILAHHGYLTAGVTVEEATYLSVYLSALRACKYVPKRSET